MARLDISSHLVHFTKGTDYEDAFARLRKIIADRKLISGTGFIKGDHCCVCFSEAPLPALLDGLVNERYYSRYSPFGIMVSKEWLFERGGRPAIYEPDAEYELLPESHRWRHVRYELRDGFERIDFTWEREWRIKCDYMEFDAMSAKIVVPDQSWASRLVHEHYKEENDRLREDDYLVESYALVLGSIVAEGYRQPRRRFPWTVLPLR